jgi:hypothetical protein
VKIGLLDIDNKNFPNLALMKISAFHKMVADEVEFVKENDEYSVRYK